MVVFRFLVLISSFVIAAPIAIIAGDYSSASLYLAVGLLWWMITDDF